MKSAPDNLSVKYALQVMAEDQLGTGFAIEVGFLQTFENAMLFPTEISATAGAHSRRRAAFRGGRACAREALHQLGFPRAAIPTDASGAPIWPEGCVGSISHTDSMAAAVVALSPPLSGLGIDLEEDGPLDDVSMVSLICRPEELVPGHDPSHPINLQHGKLLFVIKEAVYKLYWPLTQEFLSFLDVSVTLDRGAGAFRAEFVGPRLSEGAISPVVSGRFAQAEGLFIALASSRA